MQSPEDAVVQPPAPASTRRRHLVVVAALLATTVAMALVRASGTEVGRWLDERVSLVGLGPEVERQMQLVLMVPLGALVVVFFRLTLGMRMLGPFRPILIAIAMLTTGVVVGLAFTVLVLAVIVALQPRLQRRGLPYFSRLTIMLAIVVVLQVVLVLVANAMGADHLVRAAYFPIVVLCLAADGFARVLATEGLRVAAWRGSTTLAVAVIINLLYSVPGLDEATARYPELILAEVGAILLVSDLLRLELLGRLNPDMRASVFVEE